MSIIEKLFVSCQFFETSCVINYGSGWRKDVVNQRLELHPDVCLLIKGVFKEGPALPRYEDTWNIDTVLMKYLDQLPEAKICR